MHKSNFIWYNNPVDFVGMKDRVFFRRKNDECKKKRLRGYNGKNSFDRYGVQHNEVGGI